MATKSVSAIDKAKEQLARDEETLRNVKQSGGDEVEVAQAQAMVDGSKQEIKDATAQEARFASDRTKMFGDGGDPTVKSELGDPANPPKAATGDVTTKNSTEPKVVEDKPPTRTTVETEGNTTTTTTTTGGGSTTITYPTKAASVPATPAAPTPEPVTPPATVAEPTETKLSTSEQRQLDNAVGIDSGSSSSTVKKPVDQIDGLKQNIENTTDGSKGYEIRDESGQVSNLRYNEYGELYDPGTTSSVSKNLDAFDPHVTNPISKEVIPTPNILHQYASYTYCLSLHALSNEDYTRTMNSPEGYIPQNVLITSAGRMGEDFVRNPHFSEDFFFDKLTMETVIGLNSQARNANAISIEFTIIEPYGMTLLNRIMQTSTKINAGNYTDLPYLLQIDFYAFTDKGMQVKVPDITKRIPIKLAEMKMKVSQKGAEYNITAYPFNHQAFQESVSATPINLEVTASTVAEFFLANRNIDVIDEKASDQLRAIETVRKTVWDAKLKELNGKPASDVRTKEIAEVKNQMVKVIDTPVSVKSYTGAINAWLRQTANDQLAEYYDIIRFEIDEKIANATFPPKDMINKDSRAFTMAGDKSVGLKVNMNDTANPTGIMSINRGMSIIEVISLAIRNSSYIYTQILDITSGAVTEDQVKAFQKKPLEWFKIIPQIQLGEFDKKRNRYSKIVTYQIVPYTVYNTKSDDAPSGSPSGSCKKYDYIFTGKNNDILNFDLNFDTLYYVVQTARPANVDLTNQAADQTPTEDPTIVKENKILTREQVKELMADKISGRSDFQPRKVFTSGTIGAALNRDTTSESVKQLQNNIISKPGGDMISVNLKIIGDPDFIKQDDFFFSSVTRPEGNKTPNGSLITDASEIFVDLTFKTPGDYDERGLANPVTGKYTVGVFSGLYKVLTVKNFFNNGKFEQELSLIRYPNQRTQGVDESANSTEDDRPDEETSNEDARPTPISAPAMPFSGASVDINKIVSQATGKLDLQTPMSALSQLSGVASGVAAKIGGPGNPINIDGLISMTNQMTSKLPGMFGGAITGITQQLTNIAPEAASMIRPFADITNNIPQLPMIGPPPGLASTVVSSANDPLPPETNAVTGGEVYSGSVDDNGTPMPLNEDTFKTLPTGQRMAFRRAGGQRPN